MDLFQRSGDCENNDKMELYEFYSIDATTDTHEETPSENNWENPQQLTQRTTNSSISGFTGIRRAFNSIILTGNMKLQTLLPLGMGQPTNCGPSAPHTDSNKHN